MEKDLKQTSCHGSSDSSTGPVIDSQRELKELSVVTHNHDADHDKSQKNEALHLHLQSGSAHTNSAYREDDQESDDRKTHAAQLPDDEPQKAEDDEDASSCPVFQWITLVKKTLHDHRQVIGRVVGVVVLLLYLAYTGYALYLQWGTESATRLWVLLVIVLLWLSARPRRLLLDRLQRLVPVHSEHRAALLRKIARWTLYVMALGGAVVYMAFEVVSQRPRNIVSLAGIAALLIVSLLLSSDPQRVNWHTVFWGLAVQFYLAVFMLRTQAGEEMFLWVGDRLQDLLDYTDAGSQFLFGKENYLLHPLVFKLLPVILFVNALIAVAYHFGLIQVIVATFGRFLSFCLGTTPVESVNAAANVFLSLTEAPLFIKPFLATATDSELFAIMTGGLSSMAGTVMGLIISFGIPAQHVLAASVMSAPAALAVAKIMRPEKVKDVVSAQDPYKMDIGQSKNLLEAVSKAALVGMAMLVTVCANVITFIAFMALADGTLAWFGQQAGLDHLSFSRLLSYLFYPLMFLCGVDSQDLLTMGRLVGVKTMTNVVVGYSQAAEIIRNSHVFNDYQLQTNGTWHYYRDDLILVNWNQTLVGGVLTDRSVMLSTYILCGFCNISALATCLGTMTTLVPQRTKDIVESTVRAGIAGNIACFLTGCVAGLVYV